MEKEQFFQIDYDEIFYIIDRSRLDKTEDDFSDFNDSFFTLDTWEEYCVKNSLTGDEVVELLNKKQAIIEEYEDFCYNLCMFLLSKDLDDEYRRKYSKEYEFLKLGGYE